MIRELQTLNVLVEIRVLIVYYHKRICFSIKMFLHKQTDDKSYIQNCFYLSSLQGIEDFVLHTQSMAKFRRGQKSLVLLKVRRAYECFIKRFVHANKMSERYYTVFFSQSRIAHIITYYHRLGYWSSELFDKLSKECFYFA